MNLMIESMPSDIAAIGLSKAQLDDLAESRLRAIDLYTADGMTALHVTASQYAVQQQYRKPVVDVASSETVSIWTFPESASVGEWTAIGALLEVSKSLDLFLAEYLRINESARGDDASAVAEPRTKDSQETEQTAIRSGITLSPKRLPPDDEEDDEMPSFSEGVTSPQVTRKVSPEYTEKAKKSKLQDKFLVAVAIWEDGRAHNIWVLRGLGVDLDQKANETTKKWRWIAGTNGSVTLGVSARIEMSFKLLWSL